ncbi:MAG TPA: signal peptidase I [Planctomycetota bacterium]|nr:signal peptidase I [Planctomycetota bacterium]
MKLGFLRFWYCRVPIETALLLLVWFFVIQYRPTSGASMVPTLKDGAYVFVDKISYRFREPARGDVVVIKSNEKPRMLYCKRIIGMPGETIEIREGQVYINEVPLREPYIIGNTFWEKLPGRIGPGHYYVIGDNRGMSIEEHWQGLVARRNIVGRAMGKGHEYVGMGE